MVDVEAGHTPLEVCHWNTLVPTPKPVIELTLEFGLTIVAVPDNKLHVPVPTEVVLAAITVEVEHTDCDGPALAVVGGAFRVIDMVDIEAGHTPLEVCHWNTLVPIPIPVIELTLEFGLVMVAVPDNKLQVPVPAEVVLAAITVEVEHTVWLTPALAGVGGA